MLQASLEGDYDFSKHNPRERNDRVRMRLMLNKLDRRNTAEISRLDWSYYTHILSGALSGYTPEGQSKIRTDLARVCRSIQKYYDPSIEIDVAKEIAENEKREDREATDAWSKAFGDLNDPEVKAKYDATVAAMHRQTEETRKKMDESPVASVMYERELNRQMAKATGLGQSGFQDASQKVDGA